VFVYELMELTPHPPEVAGRWGIVACTGLAKVAGQQLLR
jgi:hypothetical protein